LNHCEEILYNADEILDNNYQVDDLLKKHLKECTSCRANLDKWKEIRDILSSSKITAPDMLKKNLLEIPDLTENQADNLIPWRMVISTAAAMFIFSVGLVYYFSGTTKKASVLLTSEVTTAVNSVVEQKITELRVSLYHPSAKTVSLVGDFNKWNKESLPLIKDESGNWMISIQPGKGYFQYQLLVDNKKWHLDLNNPIVIEDGFGGMNSGVLL